jgi:hypothetical protein
MNSNARAATLDPSRTEHVREGVPERKVHPAPDTTWRKTARAVGVLMLAGFLFYGIGSPVATAIAGTPTSGADSPLFAAAAIAMLVNSAIVISVGLLMFPVLRQHNRVIAGSYLLTRLFEGVGLAIGVASLVGVSGAAGVSANLLAYNIGMAGLGIGSLFFCYLLFATRLVPRVLAAVGFVGYASFAAGSLFEIAGVSGAGLLASIPGGLFEIAFSIWLIARGFSSAGRRHPAQ